MKILINATNLKQGGGIQVADSICRELSKFPQYEFLVVLSSYFKGTKDALSNISNVKVEEYDVKNNIRTIIFGRDKYLDELTNKKKIDAVLTVFGPSRWNPKCPHLSGFALAFIVMKESPYFSRMTLREKVKSNLRISLWYHFFKRSTKYFFTENPMISQRLQHKISGSKVFTVTNYYNQVFDNREQWIKRELPEFGGVTLLNISNSYPHKNLEIAIDVARYLKNEHPEFKFRFVYTIKQEQYPKLEKDLKDCFVFLGSVDVAECPSLYEQCDIVFQPTLLECFTAAYPEAMRMEKPIVTADLEFARGLCGDAACYYSAVDAKAAAAAIYRVATDESYRKQLTAYGHKQLLKYDNYEQRTAKLIDILEEIVQTEQND